MGQGKDFKKLYKGFRISFLASVPYTTTLLAIHDSLDSILKNRSTETSQNLAFKLYTRFGASTLSLLVAQSFFYPLDTVKRRLQIQGSDGYKSLYKSEIHCIQRMIKEEGSLAFYRGFLPNLIRLIPMSFI